MSHVTSYDRLLWYAVRVRYPNVYRAHIVPKGYLRGFADGDKVAVRKPGSADIDLKSVDKTGTRPRFYRRERPRDGTKIDDVEWSLSHIEDKAPRVLRSIDDLWPLTAEDKAILAELFGYQVVRGPRWMAWHDRHAVETIAKYKKLLPGQADELDELVSRITELAGFRPRLA